MTSKDPADAFPTFDTREKIDGLALKTCEKVIGGVSLQDGRKDQRDGDLAPVSQRHSGIFRL